MKGDVVKKEGPVDPSKECIDARDHGGIRPPIAIKTDPVTLRISPRLHIGEDIRPAESIDGLLRISDQKETPGPRPPDASENCVLNRVRILKLVNQGHGKPRAEGRSQVFARGTLKRISEHGEEIIVGTRSCGPTTATEFTSGVFRQVHFHGKPSLGKGLIGRSIEIEQSIDGFKQRVMRSGLPLIRFFNNAALTHARDTLGRTFALCEAHPRVRESRLDLAAPEINDPVLLEDAAIEHLSLGGLRQLHQSLGACLFP